tara:strand:+ start:768 stop:1115 length:348 start_codon:yes stop_codon:yes gene_type:complete
MKQISIQALLDDLSNGLTRTVSGKGYDSTLGSIEEKYELTKAEVKDIFQHPLLANKKTKAPKSFVLVDDVTSNVEAPIATPAYGAQSGITPSILIPAIECQDAVSPAVVSSEKTY